MPESCWQHHRHVTKKVKGTHRSEAYDYYASRNQGSPKWKHISSHSKAKCKSLLISKGWQELEIKYIIFFPQLSMNKSEILICFLYAIGLRKIKRPLTQ